MFRNALYNGDMRINQRGISTNWASPTAVGAGNLYATDRWNCFRGAYQTGACVAQGTLATTDAPFIQDGLQYFLRTGRVNGDTGTNQVFASYALESRDSYRFCGQPITVSFWYRTGSGFSGTLNLSCGSGTGTDQAWRSGFTGGVTITSGNVVNSNAWQKAAFTGFVGLAANQIGFAITYFPYGTAGGFDYFDITGVQLEKGLVATPYEILPYATELALCQRYYEQSYELGVTPGTNTSNGYVVVGGVSDSGSLMYPWIKYTVPKRAIIVPTFYTTNGTLGSWNYVKVTPAGGTASITQTSISSTSFVGSINIGSTYTGAIVYGHWVTNAEL